MDNQDSKTLNYSEFLAATLDWQNFLTEARLKVVFNQLDTDKSGKITADNVIFAMQKFGSAFRVCLKLSYFHNEYLSGMCLLSVLTECWQKIIFLACSCNLQLRLVPHC